MGLNPAKNNLREIKWLDALSVKPPGYVNEAAMRETALQGVYPTREGLTKSLHTHMLLSIVPVFNNLRILSINGRVLFPLMYYRVTWWQIRFFESPKPCCSWTLSNPAINILFMQSNRSTLLVAISQIIWTIQFVLVDIWRFSSRLKNSDLYFMKSQLVFC